MKKWYVYILKCADDTLYTGITTDTERRVKEHNDGKVGAKYTRYRTPVKLVYKKECKDRSEAAQAEAFIKSLKREDKERLVELAKKG